MSRPVSLSSSMLSDIMKTNLTKTNLCIHLCAGALLLLPSCANLAAGSTERPNSYQEVTTQPKQLDPYDYLNPAIGQA